MENKYIEKIEELLQRIMLKAYEITIYTENNISIEFQSISNSIEIKASKKELKQFRRYNFEKTIDLDDETVIDDLQEAIEFLEKLERV